MGILVVLCVFAFAIPIGLMIGAVILRASVSISNKILGPQRDSYYEDEDEDDDEYSRPRRRSSVAIPEPGIGRGMLIVLVAGIVNFGINLVVSLVTAGAGAAAGGGGIAQGVGLLGALITLPIGFLVLAGMCTAMLPTTFGRGCLVALFYNLIVIAICGVIFGVLFALGAAGGFGR